MALEVIYERHLLQKSLLATTIRATNLVQPWPTFDTDPVQYSNSNSSSISGSNSSSKLRTHRTSSSSSSLSAPSSSSSPSSSESLSDNVYNSYNTISTTSTRGRTQTGSKPGIRTYCDAAVAIAITTTGCHIFYLW